MFVDNAGPDAVLGMLPLARELIKLGTQVGGGVRLACACASVGMCMRFMWCVWGGGGGAASQEHARAGGREAVTRERGVVGDQ